MKADICKEVREKIKKIIPIPNEFIGIQVKSPRPYMGRFDGGKMNWTIDLKEHLSYSRVRQVRVKVNADESVEFDAEKLRKVYEELEAIVKIEIEKRNKIKSANKAIPDHPDFLTIRANSDQTYTIYINKHFTLDELVKFLQAMAVVQLK